MHFIYFVSVTMLTVIDGLKMTTIFFVAIVVMVTGPMCGNDVCDG